MAVARRRVPLSGGRTIEIRPVVADDIDGLIALYEELDDDDRRRRFFAAYRPRREFFVAMATADTGSGARLVAVLSDGRDEHIIGEAGYTLLPNGDGELAITVARGWRGWLGPYLLDALVETAAARKVPNLEADVLTSNGPMLAILRSRGAVTMEHMDWTVVRVLIGTKAPTATWPDPHDRPRVLVEGPAGRWQAEGEARAAGLQVLACTGPADGRRRCPALDGEPCPLAAGADVVVVSHPGDQGPWRALMDAHSRLHPGVPVCIEQAGSPATADDGLPICPHAPAAEVVAFVRRLATGEAADSQPLSTDS